jgi:hypothetical protein
MHCRKRQTENYIDFLLRKRQPLPNDLALPSSQIKNQITSSLPKQKVVAQLEILSSLMRKFCTTTELTQLGTSWHLSLIVIYKLQSCPVLFGISEKRIKSHATVNITCLDQSLSTTPTSTIKLMATSSNSSKCTRGSEKLCEKPITARLIQNDLRNELLTTCTHHFGWKRNRLQRFNRSVLIHQIRLFIRKFNTQMGKQKF